MEKAKSIALILGVLAMSVFVGYFIFAWTEPTQPPPQGNVPAPINVGPQGQAKEGGLILNTGGASIGLLVQSGNVGIGTTDPKEKLHVSGGDIYVDSGKGLKKLYWRFNNRCAFNWRGDSLYVR